MADLRFSSSEQKSFKKWFLFIILVFLLTLICSKNWFQLMLIQGNSMSPTYRNMQLVVIDKRTQNYQKGDVVVFENSNLSSVLVKRLVAGPGDTVVIRNGLLLVNSNETDLYGEALFEYAGTLQSEVVLSKGEYIVIGDNIAQSKDSRYEEIGIVQANSIIGVVR